MIISVFFILICLLPIDFIKIFSLAAAIGVMYFAVHVKSMGLEPADELPKKSHSEIVPHKVKIVIRVKASLEKLQFVLTSAQFRPDWDHLAFKADQVSENDVKVWYMSQGEGVYEENVSYKFINESDQ